MLTPTMSDWYWKVSKTVFINEIIIQRIIEKPLGES